MIQNASKEENVKVGSAFPIVRLKSFNHACAIPNKTLVKGKQTTFTTFVKVFFTFYIFTFF